MQPEDMHMKFAVIMGSPNFNGNTVGLCRPFIEALREFGAQVRYITVADKNIAPCRGCNACQQVSGAYGCCQKDDMHKIVEDIIWSDCTVVATPLYIWNCPAKLKAVIDRLHGMNKFYGLGRGSLWDNKKVALLTTNGYDGEYLPESFAQWIARLCKHAGLRYMGIYSVRDLDDLSSLQTADATYCVRAFAKHLLRG
jgi:multimeric flavodoxin WrbA